MTDIATHHIALHASVQGLLTRLRIALIRSRAERDLRIGAERLAALSPHLICDIGLEPFAQPDVEVIIFGRT